MLHARRIPRRFLFDDKMTQMTQSRSFPWAPDLRLLGHLGHTKNNDPNDPMATGHRASLQFKTVTQMTQMTQWPPAGMHGHAGASMRHASASAMAAGMRRHGRWQYPQCPKGYR
jgi:hypothetical protein